MPVWVIRGGEQNRLVDAFVDGGYIGVAYPELGDGRRIERYQATRALEVAGEPDPPSAVNRFLTFVSALAVGDAVLLPDPGRKEVVVGIVDGDYAYDESVPAARCRHRRAVRWVGRHDRDDLPGAWVDTVMKQRPAIGRHDAASLDQHVDRVVAGEVGRPARVRGRVAAPRSSPGRTRAPARPKAPVRTLRTCPGCGFNLSETVFDGQELCRDCRA